MIAVVPVREGVLPVGGEEAVCEAAGRVLFAGDGTDAAAQQAASFARLVLTWETSPFQPGAWAKALAPQVATEEIIILPACPDGRDLAPRLAQELCRPLLSGAVCIQPDRVLVTRFSGDVAQEVPVHGPIVATLRPGVRAVRSMGVSGPGISTNSGAGILPAVEPKVPPGVLGWEPGGSGGQDACPAGAASSSCETRTLELALPVVPDAEVIQVLPADPSTVDLPEAARIIAGGKGLGSADAFSLLAEVATALGASVAATRAASDAGWAPTDRFIGLSGAIVNPRLYIAMGISGATQHVDGLGQPTHVVAVNVDPSCPMMRMANLAVISDAREVLKELAARLIPLAPEGSCQ